MTALSIKKQQRRTADKEMLIKSILAMHNHKDCKGYSRIFTPWFYKCDKRGWAKRANVVASIWYDIVLADGDVVHHRDGDKQNDRPKNLEVVEFGDHSRMEVKARWESGKMKANCKDGRWSLKHDRCVECGTVERRHQGHGLCSMCYQL